MRRLISSTFVSLDGVINHMEKWHFDFIDEESNALALEQLHEADALVMGRRTYEAYAGVWPGRDGPYPARMNTMPKYVASTTLVDPAWENTTVLAGDLVDAVAALPREPGQAILMHGYGPVAKALPRRSAGRAAPLGAPHVGRRRHARRHPAERRPDRAAVPARGPPAGLGRGRAELRAGRPVTAAPYFSTESPTAPG